MPLRAAVVVHQCDVQALILKGSLPGLNGRMPCMPSAPLSAPLPDLERLAVVQGGGRGSSARVRTFPHVVGDFPTAVYIPGERAALALGQGGHRTQDTGRGKTAVQGHLAGSAFGRVRLCVHSCVRWGGGGAGEERTEAAKDARPPPQAWRVAT